MKVAFLLFLPIRKDSPADAWIEVLRIADSKEKSRPSFGAIVAEEGQKNRDERIPSRAMLITDSRCGDFLHEVVL
jgi:hypothetical protein